MYGKLQQQLQEELTLIKKEGLYKDERVIMNPQGALIKVSTGEEGLNFCANNYLGLSNHPDLLVAAKEGIDKFISESFILEPIFENLSDISLSLSIVLSVEQLSITICS